MNQKQKSAAPGATGQRFISKPSARPNHIRPTPKSAAPRILVFAGGKDCWRHARLSNSIKRNAVAMPKPEKPGQIHQECVIGCSVVVIELQDVLQAGRNLLADFLKRCGASEVAFIPFGCEPQKAVFRGLA